MQLQTIRVQLGVARLPGRSERAAQFLDVTVKDAIGICAARWKSKERQVEKEVKKRKGKLITIKEEGKMPQKGRKIK